MIVLGVCVAFCWEFGDAVLIQIVSQNLVLVFVKAVLNLQQRLMDIRHEFYLFDHTEYPPPFIILTVNKMTNSDTFTGDDLINAVMIANKLLEIQVKFIGIDSVGVFKV